MKPRKLIFWLIAALLSWLMAAGYFCWQNRSLQPAAMVRTIEKDLHQKQRELARLVSDRRLMYHLLHDALSEQEVTEMIGKPFVVRVFHNTQLIFWNANTAPVFATGATPIPRIFIQNRNVFLAQRISLPDDSSRYANVIIPIYRYSAISNQYLQRYYTAARYIPASSGVSLEQEPGSRAIHTLDGRTVCYIHINQADIAPLLPDRWLLGLCFIAIFTSVVAVHLTAFYLNRRFRGKAGTLFLLAVILICSLIQHFAGLPFHLDGLYLFSPQFFASSAFLPSFGDLAITVLLIYWLMSFVLSQSERSRKHYGQHSPLLRWSAFVLISFLTGTFGVCMLYLIQTLVMDSNISFDTNTLNVTDKFALLVFLIIAILVRLFIITLHFGNLSLNRFVPESRMKYGILMLISVVVIFFSRKLLPLSPWPPGPLEELLYAMAFLLGICYLFLKNNKYTSGFFSGNRPSSVVVQCVYWCLICAVFFKYDIMQHERYVGRLSFAEKLSRQQDTDMEMKFPDIVAKISSDSSILSWLLCKDTIRQEEMRQHFDLIYSESALSGYSGDVYLYDRNRLPITKGNTPVYDSFRQHLDASVPTISEYLFFHFEPAGNNHYIIHIPVRLHHSDSIAGYVCAAMRLRKNIVPSLYPQLLQENTVRQNKKSPGYSYAIYTSGMLKSQSGEHSFRLNIGNSPGNRPYAFYDHEDVSELYFRGSEDLVYVVAYQDTFSLGVLTIFSFLFGIYMVLYITERRFAGLLSLLITGKKLKWIYNTSLGVRIRYFALGFIIVSFLVIGISTVLFLTNRYKNNNARQLEQSVANISEVLNNYLEQTRVGQSAADFRKEATEPGFAYFISEIARQHKHDINIFDTHGQLILTTRSGIYEKRILARHMEPMAYFQLTHRQQYRFLQTEQIGSLSFISSYTSIVNHEDKVIGYLNIPSFDAQKALNMQIASLLNNLVNIYTLMLLLSSIIIFFFVSSLTRSLRLVSDSLKNVNLKENERINWPYNDEIGMLVAEYNKMVIAVEKNAEVLAKDERYNAWREMAKQVAHEIKNPLTPMKLNIQYLQQAIAQNHPDITSMVKRVSASIIEQIDNLAYIASEFSNFAKMPEQHIEQIDLAGMLRSIVALYEGKSTEITLHLPAGYDPLIIPSDKSQTLRIFTNLIQNAADAIPPGRKGKVVIEVKVNAAWHNILITIADNGDGIAESIRDKIFEPYFTTKTAGTGLGLAMTKKIIELWGGEIWFESHLDSGTIFFIVLPFHETAAAEQGTG